MKDLQSYLKKKKLHKGPFDQEDISDDSQDSFEKTYHHEPKLIDYSKG